MITPALATILMSATRTPAPASPEVREAVGNAASPAAYTLLGAVIAACVSLLSVVIKYRLDMKTEARKHDQELAKMRLQLGGHRQDKLREERRTVFARYLSATAVIYQHIGNARRERRIALDSAPDSRTEADRAYVVSLKGIAPEEAQVALEECRLVGDKSAIRVADSLWTHIRGSDLATGADTSGAAWDKWKEAYWSLRRELVEELRASLSSES